MGFVLRLMLVYLALSIVDALLFAYGRGKGKWLPFILLTAAMALGIVVLGVLWFLSPM